MVTQHGRLEEFHPESDSNKAYLEHVTLYFTANAVSNDKRVAVLLSSIGAPTYSLLSDLVASHLPSTKSLDEIQRPSATTTSRRKPLSRNNFTFKNATKPWGRLSPNLTPHSESLLLIANSGELSRILSEIALCAVYDTNPSNADCCRKKTSNIATPWRSRAPWRPLTEIPRLSRVLNLRFVNLPATLPEFGKRTATTVAVAQTI